MSSKTRIFNLLLILILLLSACDALDDESGDDSGEDQDTETTEYKPDSGGKGKIIYDLGFRPEKNGFAFENYGDEDGISNLTATEMRRMFGDRVCSRIKNGKCTLTPPAKKWMKEINDAMSGGHCEGMAALSLMMYTDQVKEKEFGGTVASDLDIDDKDLQREIAYWWATQTLEPTENSVITGTPTEILKKVQTMSASGETYTIGIYKEDGSDGHAITPFGVKDKGKGVYAILVYDNNYPGETRELLVNTKKDTWQYESAINPKEESDLYTGDAETETLDLTPTSVRFRKQKCPFCSKKSGESAGAKQAATEPELNQVFLDGDGHILITTEDGKRLGYADGKIVNEIPGARFTAYRMKASMDAPEPIYWIPADLDVTISIDGTTLKEETETDLIMVGPGFTIGIEGIILEPGQVDTAYFFPSDETITYETDQDESPYIVVGVEQDDADDYYFEVQGANMKGGGSITVILDSEAGDLLINTEKLKNEGSFDFYLTRENDEVEEEFSAEEIALKAGALVYVNYAEWSDENPNGITFEVDLDGDGEMDDEYVVDDATE